MWTRAISGASSTSASRMVRSPWCAAMTATLPNLCPGRSPLSGRSAREAGATSDGALDLAGLEARGAHVDPLGRPGHHGAHALDVGVEAPLGADVGVRDGVPEAGALAADLAVRSHVNSPGAWHAARRRSHRLGCAAGLHVHAAVPGTCRATWTD